MTATIIDGKTFAAGVRARAFTPDAMLAGYLDAYGAAIECRRLACAS